MDQVVNKRFLRYELNFLIAAKRTGFALRNVFLLCLDEELAAPVLAATNGDVRCVEVHSDTIFYFNRILRIRTKVLACLVGEGGLDVVLSDTDALWITNPLEDLRTIRGDILAQRGGMPEEYSDPVNGVTICLGFAMFRGGSKGMSTFLKRWLQQMETVGDDQVAVNMAASSLNTTWVYEEGESPNGRTEDRETQEYEYLSRGELVDSRESARRVIFDIIT